MLSALHPGTMTIFVDGRERTVTQGTAIAVATILALGLSVARADPIVDYSVGVSVEHNDNVNYSASDPVSENILTPELNFMVAQKGASLDASAAGNIQYRDYIGGAFGNELRTLLAGGANWHLIPGRLDWVFEENAGRQPIDVLRSNAPTNQQQTNVFSTGPTFTGKFTEVLRGQVDVRYTNSFADTTEEFNSNRFGAVGTLLYQLDPNNTLSASATGTQVRYTKDVSTPFDYDRTDGYVGYQRITPHFTLEGAAGYSWLDLRAFDKQSGALLRGSARWTPDKQTSLGVTLSRQYSDAAQNLVFTPGQLANVGIGSGLNVTVVAPQVYIEKRLSVDFTHGTDSWRFTVSPFGRRLHYVQGDFFDENSRGFYADAAYYLRTTLWLGANIGVDRRDYTRLQRVDDDQRIGLSLTWQRTRNWLLVLAANRERRDSDAAEDSYSANSISVSAVYKR